MCLIDFLFKIFLFIYKKYNNILDAQKYYLLFDEISSN